MKACVGFMNWDMPNPTFGERAPKAHTPCKDASLTYHTVSLTPNQGSQIKSISQAI